jgi:hypothetical protein
MEKAKVPASQLVEAIPVFASRFQKLLRADNIRFDELGGSTDRAVNVRFGSEMQDRGRLMFREQPAKKGTVTNVTADKVVMRRALKRTQRCQVSGVGEQIKIHNPVGTRPGEPTDKRASNEPRTARYE